MHLDNYIILRNHNENTIIKPRSLVFTKDVQKITKTIETLITIKTNNDNTRWKQT